VTGYGFKPLWSNKRLLIVGIACDAGVEKKASDSSRSRVLALELPYCWGRDVGIGVDIELSGNGGLAVIASSPGT
jgi:hypothetical protein